MYAGFWIRLAAHGLDWILLVLLDVVVCETAIALAEQTTGWPPRPGVLVLSALAANFLYYAVFTASPMQASPGKYLLGLRVVDASLAPCRLPRALVRSFAYALSWASLGGGFALSGVTSGKRALHDYVAGTRVLRRARAEAVGVGGGDPAERAARAAMASGVMLGVMVGAAVGVSLIVRGDYVDRLGGWFGTVASVARAGRGPGTHALAAVGCRARVMTLAQAANLVAPFALGEFVEPQLGGVPYLTCRRRDSSAPFDCATVARRWLGAVENAPPVFIVAVYPRRGWAPLCRTYFDARGRPLGAVGPRGVLLPAPD